MRIAFLAPRFHSNQSKLVEYLIENNNFVKFYVSRIGKSEDHTILEPTIIKFNYLFKIIKKLINSKDVLFDYTYGLPALKELFSFKKNKFDVIIIRDPYSIVSFCYALTSKMIGTRIVFYTQREIHRKPHSKKDKIVNGLIKFFNAKWISPCLGDKKYNKTHDQLYYVPFCMDIVKYEKHWFIDDTVNILCIGKFVKRKNHHLLIEALIPLATKYEFNLTIIGEVSEVTGNEYYNYILDISKDLPFKINIKINIDRDDVFEEYKKHDIFVLPSRDEPASVSNLEAMSFGLPIITSDTNKTSTYTQENGFIFNSDSVDNLNLKLTALLRNRKEIVNMGNKSLELVEKNHNSEIVYKYLFEEVLNV